MFGLDQSIVCTPHQGVGVVGQIEATPTSCAPMIDDVLRKVAKKAGLVATDTWSAKVKEILTMIRLTKRHSECILINAIDQVIKSLIFHYSCVNW